MLSYSLCNDTGLHPGTLVQNLYVEKERLVSNIKEKLPLLLLV